MAVKTAIRFVCEPLIDEIVVLEPVSVVVLSRVKPPLVAVVQAGIPEATFKT
jgi:hypothetical protein